jgi:hypothetical protein
MKLLRLAAIGLAVVGAAALFWLLGGNAFARYRERQTERAWVQSFGTLQDLLIRYPKTVTNDTARRLEHLVRPFDLDLTPKTSDSLVAEAVSTTNAPGREALRPLQAAARYLTAQLERPEASIDPPQREVKDFFVSHGDDLHALEAELLASPPARWDFDPSSLPDRQPIPNIYAVLTLQRALLAEALVEAVSENAATAGLTLEASWKLNQTLREIPDSLCQIMALGIARLQVGALRKVDVDVSPWLARLAEQDFKRSVLDTELLSSWPSSERYRQLVEIESHAANSSLKRLEASFLEPYANIVWAQVTEGFRLEYLAIRDSALSDREVPEPKTKSKSTAAEVLLSISLPNKRNLFRRVDSFILDAELTSKVLEARQLRLQNGVKWPTAIPGIEVTRFPGAKWLYSVSPRGSMSLYLSKEPNWNTGGFVLPLRFTSS